MFTQRIFSFAWQYLVCKPRFTFSKHVPWCNCSKIVGIPLQRGVIDVSPSHSELQLFLQILECMQLLSKIISPD